jgi:bifunctional non-homologous end joining protein LigD
MSLTEYRRKRNARRTPEPMPELRAKTRSPGQRLRFVVQKHAASHLHYDFRLELDGVLKSWAVPKGPSLDPSEKHLAMQVEDHPLEYADFEGIIPEGEYGGGTVMVWDRGQWEPAGDPRKAYEQGRLKFRLQGQKLRGGWTLVRMGGRAAETQRRQWLLIKERDEEARPADEFDVRRDLPDSAVTGRSLEDIAAQRGQVWESGRAVKKTRSRRTSAKPSPVKIKKTTSRAPAASRIRLKPSNLTNARKAAMPGVFHPQLATLVKSPPSGDEWLHEIKYDGYRILGRLSEGRARLITRRGNDWTARFGRIAAAITKVPVDQAILDGEAVILNPDGTTNFQALQNALKDGRDASLVYYVFDLPYCNGYDLTRTPLLERKEFLKKLLAQLRDAAGPVRFSDHIVGRGLSVFKQACQYNMEGIVCKRADSPYAQRRTDTWLKVKCFKSQEFVLVGYTDPRGARSAFGALLLGYYNARGDLIYCGRVGTGFSQGSLRQIYGLLKKRVQSHPPVSNPPTGAEARGVHWVRPELVGQVAFSEWTTEGILRHPSFLGLREDKDVRQVVRETPATPSSGGSDGTDGPARDRSEHSGRGKSRPRAARAQTPPATQARAAELVLAGVRITHPDRVLYPEQQVTKAALAGYYAAVADWILPHVIDRPLAIVRCPEGRAKNCFYQKHVSETLPATIHGVTIRERNQARGEPDAVQIAISDLSGLISLVQFGVLEIHPWGARADNVERPDRLYFDLDPDPEVPWQDVIQAAYELREQLADLGLDSFVKTSGGKGLHVVIPIARRSDWAEARAFTKAIAERMARAAPQRYLATMSKSRRKGKIFIDYLRNTRGATAIAPYSTRARPGAPVSAPLAWDELGPQVGPAAYNVQNTPIRLSKLKRDPWDGFLRIRQTITATAKSKLGI